MNARAVLVGVILGAGGVLSARAEVRLRTSVEPREVTVGDPIELRVTAVPDGGTPVPAPDPASGFGPFEVLRFSSAPAAGGPGVDFHWTLAVYEVGVSTLPPVAFAYGGARPGRVSTPAVPLVIRSVLPPNATGFKGIKGKLNKVFDKKANAVLLGVLAILALIWAFLRRRKTVPVAPPGPPPRPAHETALEALALLEGSTDPAKIYYSRLTDILRAYLEGRFQIPALDRTTVEISAALKAGPFSVEQRRGLKSVLDNSDLAKFAKREPGPEERLTDWTRVRDFVDGTRPGPAVPT